uniref:Reverse transcriptase Ty1/copia-type domain-containing protein n=1 Tax=Cannabis sativa TaxID=3483 RepID=A0A803PAV2_CANSA
MVQPPGFVDPEHPDYVCKLQKALYGLKQAPRACALSNKFSLKDLGDLHYFSGIQVLQTIDGLLLSQQKYLQDLLCKAEMQGVKTQNSPVNAGLRLSQYGSEPIEDPSHYREFSGIWLALWTLDSKFSTHLQAFCDADWAADPDDRRSTTGFCVFHGDNLITWQSRKQTTISRSSTEAEFQSLAAMVYKLTWIQSLLSKLHYKSIPTPTIWCDNVSSVMLAANPILHARTKHVE